MKFIKLNIFIVYKTFTEHTIQKILTYNPLDTNYLLI